MDDAEIFAAALEAAGVAALATAAAETGHHLYALGTPMPGAMEGVAAPWFEQPGGGAMVVLERPVRWYVDQGYLVELV